jgi:hypothetical protein
MSVVMVMALLEAVPHIGQDPVAPPKLGSHHSGATDAA